MTNVDFPPLANGMDYLQSVVQHLADDPGPRDLKYAVLHLQAATEVLLKARLEHEHWSLVFKDPGKATRKRFESGDFESCTIPETVYRLRHIAGIELDDQLEDETRRLAKDRNALQHYGLQTPAAAVKARAAAVLDLLLSFVHEHLLSGDIPSDDELLVSESLSFLQVQQGLNTIHAYISTRMQRMRVALEQVLERTIRCPECDQWALVVDDRDAKGNFLCQFCREIWPSADDLAMDYEGSLSGEPRWVQTAWGGLMTPPCPACGSEAFVERAHLADAPEQRRCLCFHCGRAFDDQKLALCSGCERRFLPTGTETICESCRNFGSEAARGNS
ncbi:hypothetical protein [Streptomyces sp. NPDC094472]|uniref:hypothetical protein n=1 Tax=Streptomyces sp. NPDC094472 TaxID=3155080 RepID=UPI00331CAA33